MKLVKKKILLFLWTRPESIKNTKKDSSLDCVLCNKTANNTIQTTCCGILSCYDCIINWFQKLDCFIGCRNSKCIFVKDKHRDQMASYLIKLCENSINGCMFNRNQKNHPEKSDKLIRQETYLFILIHSISCWKNSNCNSINYQKMKNILSYIEACQDELINNYSFCRCINNMFKFYADYRQIENYNVPHLLDCINVNVIKLLT